MISLHGLRKRDFYLRRLKTFQDTEPVKVVTGIRRCGKSSLLRLMIADLRANGIVPEQIIEMNFESMAFCTMLVADFYAYVKERVLPDRRMYLFFDEVQRLPGWENAVNSFRVDFNCDIYVTGSNAYMLSSEYATYLSGRCVEIEMLPLSFAEFLDFHGYEIRETEIPLGGVRKQISDGNGDHYTVREIFDIYLRYGGMLGLRSC
jgi:predicted AAA+ superfamily ATPase